jgi:hypothetical protein
VTTKLDRPIKREVQVGERLYTVTLDAAGLKVVEKGKRQGHEISWSSIVSGDTELTQDLRISLDATRE